MKALFRPGALLVALFCWLASLAWAEVPVPPLQARVTDLTSSLSAGQVRDLESELKALETRLGAQMAVLLVPSTQPESIEQFSLRVVEAWKLGKKGKDDGLLLLVAKQDRRIRIEVGYGLEGAIPDARAKRIIDEVITPRFKQGDLAGGIKAGVEGLAALIEGRQAQASETAPSTPAGPKTAPVSSDSGPVWDLTGTLSPDQTWAYGRRLGEFYDSGRAKPAFVLVIPSSAPEPLPQYAAKILAAWSAEDNLDVDRSLLLVMARDEGIAHIEAGAGLKEKLLPGAAERAAAEVIAPRLRSGDLAGAVETGVEEVEKLIDGAIANKTFSESLAEKLADMPFWLLIALVAVGTGVRWLLGPLFGAIVMAGAVGAGAWWVSGAIQIAIFAGLFAFIFVLVGLGNWIGMSLGGSSGGGSGFSSGGGGLSGGGGDFGGGGASGSW